MYPKNSSTHTVDLTFTVTPGEIYHLAAVDLSAFSPDVQAVIARDSKLRPGVVADQDAFQEIATVLEQHHLSRGATLKTKVDHEHHLATITLIPPPSKH